MVVYSGAVGCLIMLIRCILKQIYPYGSIFWCSGVFDYADKMYS